MNKIIKILVLLICAFIFNSCTTKQIKYEYSIEITYLDNTTGMVNCNYIDFEDADPVIELTIIDKIPCVHYNGSMYNKNEIIAVNAKSFKVLNVNKTDYNYE